MSERTAMRTLPNLAVRRSPWPSLARPGIARERGRRRPTRGGDDEPVVVEARARPPSWTSTDPPPRASIARLPGGQLAGRASPRFPGDEDPAGREQRKRELDELGERGHRAGGDGRPAAAMAPRRRRGPRPGRRPPRPCRPARWRSTAADEEARPSWPPARGAGPAPRAARPRAGSPGSRRPTRGR